jgi:hypothetical protein
VGAEIHRSRPTLRINYDFCPDPKYKSQIKKLENCHKSNIPIGNIFKTVKAKNKIRGLGKIVSSEGSNPNKKNYIQITESTDNESPDFTLDDTASGYFETIGIFTALVIGSRNVIFLDEPGVTFTSNQNKILWQNANGYVQKASNCDNSLPYFIELSLFSHGRNLVSVRNIGLRSHIATKSKDLSTIS